MGILEKALEIVFPSSIYCISCGSVIDASRDYALCDNCMEHFHWVGEKTCEKCGKILDVNERRDVCHDCRNFEHDFDKGFTCVQYGLLERGVLMDFKYKGKSYIGRKLGELLYDRIQLEDIQYNLVVPVPMHQKRQNERGYNQAAVMAAELAKKAKVDYAPELLKRKAETQPMKGLGAFERRENLKNIFEVSPKNHYTIAGKNILLIDDIYTTGSTLDACSRVLKDAGAAKVYGLTFACGANIPPKI